MRRLGAPQQRAFQRANDAMGLVDFLERVGHWQRRDGGLARAHVLHHSVDGCIVNERSRCIMNKDDARLVRQVIEATGDRLRSRFSSGRDHESVDVTLENPWWRVTGVFVREDADDADHVPARHEALQTVKQHWLASYPAQLLQLPATGACARSAGNDHDTDVACRVRRGRAAGVDSHANSFSKSWVIVRTPMTWTSLVAPARFGTPRSATKTRVIPMFAASAMRRST